MYAGKGKNISSVPGAADKLTSSEYLKSCKSVGVAIGQQLNRIAQR